ncbi:MAG: AAA family ATPase [Bacteroides sp.]
MGRFVNKGNDGFASVCNSNYVDKSLLIDEVNSVMLTENRFMCVTRARRFGKSVAVKMLNAYYDKSCDSRQLFSNLAISQCPSFEKHLNRYPVIYLDITDFLTKYGGGNEQIVDKMKHDLTEELLSQYADVTMTGNDDLMDLLVKIVERTGEKFVCLIDEWDALCREGREQVMDEYVELLRRLFKGSQTDYVFSVVYITGILPIKRYNTQSALNNFEEYTMLSPAQLAPYFGFREEEVATLCAQKGMDVAEMKRWYDGYQLGAERSIYNPYAVMRALKRGAFESYWASTNTFESLKRYITMNFEGLKDDIVSALSDVPVRVNSLRFSNDMHKVSCKDDVLTLLCHLGYLSYNAQTKRANIPNYEVRQEFETAVADTGWTGVTDALGQSEHLLACVLTGDADAVANGVDEVHRQNTSVLKYNDENALACVLSLAFYTARSRFWMIRELPTGKGFADIVLLPRRDVDMPAILLELKYDKDAPSAISQIKRQDYVDALAHYVGEVILVGINYDKVTKRHSCIIERFAQ